MPSRVWKQLSTPVLNIAFSGLSIICNSAMSGRVFDVIIDDIVIE
ncbi:MAG TPA: hypothetical protein VGF45_10145 [Polyangia bacterium]